MYIVQSFKDEVSLVHAKGYVCHGRYISISFFDFRFCFVAFNVHIQINLRTSLWILSAESLLLLLLLHTQRKRFIRMSKRRSLYVREHRSHCYCWCCVCYFLWVFYCRLSSSFCLALLALVFVFVFVFMCARVSDVIKPENGCTKTEWTQRSKLVQSAMKSCRYVCVWTY